MTASLSVLFSIKNVRDKSCRDDQQYILFSITFFFSENHVVYKIMWKNTVKPDMSPMTTKHVPQTLYLHAGELRQEYRHPRTIFNIYYLITE